MRWLLGLVIVVQPWWRWPAVFPDVSARLTLVLLCFSAAVYAVARPSSLGLPGAWAAWVSGFLIAVAWSAFPVLREGRYFDHFLETAALCDGVLVVVACWMGLWAFTQASQEDFRWVRRLGVGLLLVNLVVSAWQAGHLPRVTGVFLSDRLLAAYALAWLPVCWVWRRPLILLPLLLLAITHKPLVLIVGGAAVVWRLRGWRWAGLTAVAVTAGWLASTPAALALRTMQRMDTWRNALHAVWDRPLGYGFSPLVLNTVRQEYGYLLPSLHSDWLMLAVGAGLLIAVWAGWLWWQVCWARPVTETALALQVALFSLGCVSCVQSTLSHASVGGVAFVFLAWWLVEQRKGVSDA